MDSIMYWLGVSIAYLTTFIILFMSVDDLIGRLFLRIEQLKWDKAANHFASEMTQLGRWCGYEFPIVKDIEEEYREAALRGVQVDISSFRNRLRRKYKENQQETEVEE